MTPDTTGTKWVSADRRGTAAAAVRVDAADVTYCHVSYLREDGSVRKRGRILRNMRTGGPVGYVSAKDALPEAKANDAEHVCGVSDCATGELCGVSAATPPAAPSPLEVVRKSVRDMLRSAPANNGKVDADALLATLEESIRADERARVGDELQRRGYPVAGGAVLAMKR